MFKLCFDEAQTAAGLGMNNVAKSYLLLRSSGLSEKRKDDLLVHVAGGLNRYDDITRLMSRLSRSEQGSASSSVPAMSGQYWQEQEWQEDDWNDGWSWQDTGTWHSWDDDWWSSPDEWTEGSWDTSSWQEASQPPADQPAESEDLFGKGGKGKGKKRGGAGKRPWSL